MLKPSVAAALLLAWSAMPALAQADIVVQARKIPLGQGEVRGEVPFGDLDLKTDAGVATLTARVEAEAKKLCGPKTNSSVNESRSRARCYDEVMESARPRIEEAVAYARH